MKTPRTGGLDQLLQIIKNKKHLYGRGWCYRLEILELVFLDFWIFNFKTGYFLCQIYTPKSSLDVAGEMKYM